MIDIRVVEETDWSNWCRLWTNYLAFHETTLPDQHKRIAFDRLLDSGTRVHGILAVQGDTPVGLAHYVYHDHMWRPEGTCYLQDLCADPHQRGLGVERKLVQAVYDAADEMGVPNVYSLTQDFNSDARQLYDRVATLTSFIKYQRT